MILHLAGGEAGITHALDQFGPALATWWATMTTPALSEETRQQLIEGVAAEAGGRALAELARTRDEMLLSLLELLAKRSVAI